MNTESIIALRNLIFVDRTEFSGRGVTAAQAAEALAAGQLSGGDLAWRMGLAVPVTLADVLPPRRPAGKLECTWRAAWGWPSKSALAKQAQGVFRKFHKQEAQMLADAEELAATPVPVCPMCQSTEFRTRAQQSSSGCLIGLVILFLGVALA
jgi:hypothetical protein